MSNEAIKNEAQKKELVCLQSEEKVNFLRKFRCEAGCQVVIEKEKLDWLLENVPSFKVMYDKKIIKRVK